ncbi:MAG: hypothetical protein JWM20_302 [Patescibacteria group bacterium]|nr:hypothetical protein [Patescibacteria group bacterium]
MLSPSSVALPCRSATIIGIKALCLLGIWGTVSTVARMLVSNFKDFQLII